ncbi:hypothetical protein RCL1_007901 [Eukaryota sp. TZLM3-RCL]
MAKNYSAVLIDVSPDVQDHHLDAQNMLSTILEHILACSPSEYVSVHYFGSNNSENELELPHIDLIRDFAKLDVPSIKQLTNFDCETGIANIFDALKLGNSSLSSSGTAASKLTLYLISPFAGTTSSRESTDVIKLLCNSKVSFNIVNILDHDPLFHPSNDLWNIIESLVDSCNANIYFKSEAFYHFSLFSKSWTFRVDCKAPMEFGSSGAINIRIYAKVKTQPLFTRSSTVKEVFEMCREEEMGCSTVNAHNLPKLKRETVVFDPKDPTKQLSKEETVKGYFYGTTVVTLTEDERLELKAKGQNAVKNIRVVGFIKKKQVPRVFFTEGVDIIVGESDQDKKSLTALHSVLKQNRMCMVVRMVKRANSNPVVMVLIPVLEGELSHFIAHKIPYLDDIRPWVFDPLPDPVPAHVDVAGQFIDSMMLSDEDYVLADTPNPVLQNFHKLIVDRAMCRINEEQLPKFDEKLSSIFHGKRELYENSTEILDQLLELCPVTREIPTSSKRKSMWRETMNEVKDTKKVHEDDQPIPRVSLSFDNPAEELIAYANQTELFRAALSIAADRVGDFLATSIGSTNYNRAVSLLVAMRNACLKNKDSSIISQFNQFLIELRKLYDGAYMSGFFTLLLSSNCSLISDEEVGMGGVPSQEAEEFLSQFVQKGEGEKEVEEAKVDEDEDLLDLF